jgi:anaerobic carbon-monoxide dehydrogenase catalytic subunit
VGVCGATIDTIMARNFGRMVAAGTAAHTDHEMGMLELFREVINGNIKEYSIRDPRKLEAVAESIGRPGQCHHSRARTKPLRVHDCICQ